MSLTRRVLPSLFLALTAAVAFAADTPAAPAPDAATGAPTAEAMAKAIASAPVIHLWANGAPGFESRKDEPEKVLKNRQVNIHNPSVTVFLPKHPNGAAMIIAPGGGHGHLAIDHEGYTVAQYLANHGVVGFALKYRLSKDEATDGKTPYTIEGHELADVQRAIRLVRARAGEWGIDPARVGMMGFSAGGELALLSVTHADAGKADAPDPIDRQNARPDFVALMYPGGLTRTEFTLTKDMPPFFLACGGDDRIADTLAPFYLACRKAGLSAELHIYAGTGHGFGIQESTKTSAQYWPGQLLHWLHDRKVMGEPKS